MWRWAFFWSTFWLGSNRISRAEPRDAARLAAIHAESFAIGWDQLSFEQMLIARDHCGDCLVLRGFFGEIAMGFALSRLVLDEAELLTIALDPEARGRGLARTLLLHHASRVRIAGAMRLYLEVAEDNLPARALYRSLGLIETGRRKGYYPAHAGGAHHQKSRDALTMVWDLSAFDPTPRPDYQSWRA
jgi:[ribosomal protein S18]-alanine N-acetyltransferase